MKSLVSYILLVCKKCGYESDWPAPKSATCPTTCPDCGASLSRS